MINFDGSFSAADLRSTLHALGKKIFFVQIGAMDGITYDPINQQVQALEWQGVLAEPIPYLYSKLQMTYKGCKGLQFAQVAITDFDGQIEMTFIDPGSVEPGVFAPGAFGTSTLMLDRGLFGGKHVHSELSNLLKAHSTNVIVNCCRLQTLFETYKIERLDLMVVDTEGADWMIVRQLDLLKYRPKLVYLEYVHLSDYEKIACASHFRNFGYRIYIDMNAAENFLAVRDAVEPSAA